MELKNGTVVHGTITDSQFEFLGSILGSKQEAKGAIFYSYRRNVNGFAAVLDEDRVAEIAKHPKVVSVPNQQRKLHTTQPIHGIFFP